MRRNSPHQKLAATVSNRSILECQDNYQDASKTESNVGKTAHERHLGVTVAT